MNKTLVLTGGSSGIGLAISKVFLEDGYRVYNLDIKDSGIGEYVFCDVTNHEDVEQCVNQIVKDTNVNDDNIDVVISCAGIHVSANIENTSPELLEKVLSINVKGAYSLTKACLPYMKKAGGSIIYIASEQALVAKSNSFAYNLSKHALASMAKTTAIDYASHNIRVNAICPGTIETPLYHNAIDAYCERSGADKDEVHSEEAQLQPLGRIGQPDEVASFARYLASDQAAFITGSLQLIDGGYTAR